ncbi:MAG: ABC transporter permease, partial [Chloroflexi bacterium]
MPVLTIARLTLREASRRRLLLAVAILTLVVAMLSAWGFHRLLTSNSCGNYPNVHPCSAATLKVIASALLILLAFMFSFVLALGAAFLAAPSIAGDIESGIALSMLPRPIRRSDVVLGKWLGFSALLALYAGIACGIEFVISDIALNYVPPHPVIAVLFIVAEAVVVLTLTLLGSTRIPAITCGIVVFVLFGMTWIGGIVGNVGATLHNSTVQNIGTVSTLLFPTDGLWRGAIYNLEPLATIVVGSEVPEARANPFFVSDPPTTPYLLWSAAWVMLLLGAATWSFYR